MSAIAFAVLVLMVPLSVWAWRQRPGTQAKDEFLQIWRNGPWGKQIIVDFYALQLLLALWMIADASEKGLWLEAVLCIGLMPVLGAMSAAVYWLLTAS